VWGCLAYCRVTDPKRSKLGPRALKCAFLGYAHNSKAYRVLDLESNTIMESRDVEFFENSLTSDNTGGQIINGTPTDEINDHIPDTEPESGTPIENRRSQRARREKTLSPDEIDSQRLLFHLVEGDRNNVTQEIPIVLSIEDDEPKSYREAMSSRDSAFWKEAINDERGSLLSNQA